jgi:hypothetical protein
LIHGWEYVNRRHALRGCKFNGSESDGRETDTPSFRLKHAYEFEDCGFSEVLDQLYNNLTLVHQIVEVIL